jgi:hypothetical protein
MGYRTGNDPVGDRFTVGLVRLLHHDTTQSAIGESNPVFSGPNGAHEHYANRWWLDPVSRRALSCFKRALSLGQLSSRIVHRAGIEPSHGPD